MDDKERFRELEARHNRLVRQWHVRRDETNLMRVELAETRKRLLLAELATDKEHGRVRAARQQMTVDLNAAVSAEATP